MKKRFFVIIVVLSLLLTGCASAPKSSSSYGGVANSAPAASPNMDSYYAEEMEKGAIYDQASTSTGMETNDMVRLVIRNADLSIVVDDPAITMNMIGRMAERMGGYVVSSASWKTKNYQGMEIPEASITVRVPATLLNQALDEIRALLTDKEKDMLRENVSGQDVTKEYTDLNSKLKNLEDAESQLRKIMDAATNTEDVLDVFKQLTYYREQIELTKGQIKYYEESAALSAVNISIQAHEALNPITIAGWKPSVTVNKALQKLVNAFQGIVDGFIWVILLVIPVMVMVLLPFYLLFLLIRFLVRRSNKKKRKIDNEKKD